MAFRRDQTGKRFGELTVLEYVGKSSNRGESLYRCRCSCGQEKVLSSARFVNGYVRTCGHTVRLWTDEELLFLQQNYSRMCVADISAAMGRSASAIRTKAHELSLQNYIYIDKKCIVDGCDRLSKEPGGGNGMCSLHRQRMYRGQSGVKQRYREWASRHRSTMRGRYSAARFEAKRRGLDFSITFEEYCAIRCGSNDECFYHKGPIDNNGGSLDRIDNSKGYSIDNCILSCAHCNKLRGEYLSVEETLEVVALLKKLRGLDNIWKNAPKLGISSRTKKG